MSIRVAVDHTKCRSYGVCVDIAATIFELNRYGQATTIGGLGDVLPDELAELAREAADGCPVLAITVDDVDERAQHRMEVS